MPPSDTGGRVVRVGDKILGTAYRLADLLEFLRRAGLDPDSISLTDPGLIDWRGGGAADW